MANIGTTATSSDAAQGTTNVSTGLINSYSPGTLNSAGQLIGTPLIAATKVTPTSAQVSALGDPNSVSNKSFLQTTLDSADTPQAGQNEVNWFGNIKQNNLTVMADNITSIWGHQAPTDYSKVAMDSIAILESGNNNYKSAQLTGVFGGPSTGNNVVGFYTGASNDRYGKAITRSSTNFAQDMGGINSQLSAMSAPNPNYIGSPQQYGNSNSNNPNYDGFNSSSISYPGDIGYVSNTPSGLSVGNSYAFTPTPLDNFMTSAAKEFLPMLAGPLQPLVSYGMNQLPGPKSFSGQAMDWASDVTGLSNFNFSSVFN